MLQPASPPPPGLPSNACDAGQRVVDFTSEGVHVKLYTRQPSSQEVDVCVRAEDLSAGIGYGGEVVITPTVPGVSVGGVGIPSVGVPSVDSNANYCSTTSGNQVPGSHPVVSGGVGSVSLLLDTYLNSSSAWVCVQAGSVVNECVVVPITIPGVGIPSVTVTPGRTEPSFAWTFP